jgi:hypothetical protein
MDTEGKNSMRYSKIVAIRLDVGDLDGLGSRATLVLNIHFEAERRHTFKLDGDDFISSKLFFAVLVRLARFDEVG